MWLGLVVRSTGGEGEVAAVVLVRVTSDEDLSGGSETKKGICSSIKCIYVGSWEYTACPRMNGTPPSTF